MKLRDLYIGQEERISVQFSMDQLKAFANITQDFNPEQFDPIYASKAYLYRLFYEESNVSLYIR